MYPSLKTPVIGLELIPLNLTALYCPCRAAARAERELGTRRGGVQNPECWRLLERREVEEAGDAVYIEEMKLLRVPREAHRDDRRIGEEQVVLPHLERDGREYVVIADHD